MTPAVTAARLTGASRRDGLPLLVLGPALGTTADALWRDCAAHLVDRFDVLAWDLPGHGYNTGVPREPFTVADLAAAVLAVVEDVLVQRGTPHDAFAYAGDSVGGAVGLQLLLDAPERVASAVLLCTGARLGEPGTWHERIARVTDAGTASLVDPPADSPSPSPAGRWFGTGFADREPAVAARLLGGLPRVSDAGYVRVCEALADFDVRHRLGEVVAPLLAVAGEDDLATPPALLRDLADGVPDGRVVTLPGVGHLAPAEAPAEVAGLVRRHVLGEDADLPDADLPDATDPAAALEALRADRARDAHWSRPGLDRRSRSLVTLAALVARGASGADVDRDELAAHLRTARAHGLSVEELRECLLQTAVLTDLPADAPALRTALHLLDEETR
jgi:3-oxoadipate enol-lactonase / 4-carboxymuconolactone decarboxylase